FVLLLRPTPRSHLFPYTTLFRSEDQVEGLCCRIVHQRGYMGASSSSSSRTLSASTCWRPCDRIHEWKPGTDEWDATVVHHNSSQQQRDPRCPTPRAIPVHPQPRLDCHGPS